MKKLIFIILLVSLALYSSAQKKVYFAERRPLNNAAINICGDASILSLHYERLFVLNPNLLLAGKLGIGFDEPTIKYLFGYTTPPNDYFIALPHHLTCNLGKGRHFFEFGLGGSLVWEGSSRDYCLYPVAGYRLQPMKTNKLHIRFYGALPISGNEEVNAQFTPLGLSLGICF